MWRIADLSARVVMSVMRLSFRNTKQQVHKYIFSKGSPSPIVYEMDSLQVLRITHSQSHQSAVWICQDEYPFLHFGVKNPRLDGLIWLIYQASRVWVENIVLNVDTMKLSKQFNNSPSIPSITCLVSRSAQIVTQTVDAIIFERI
jgi:hypothetical protein